MKRTLFGLGVLLIAGAAQANAQGVSITPVVGVYIPASDLYALRDEAQQISVDKEGTFALGMNVELGMLRGTIAYATGSQINQRGVQDRDNIGEGKLLAVAGDVVLRPIPRFLIQPYLLVGAGLRREDYSYEDDGLANSLPKDQSDFAFHAGVGIDAMLGRVGIVAEVTDFITKNEADEYKQHDAFGFVGLRMRIF